MGEKAKKFTNVYIKNFGDDLYDEKLKEGFSKFGKITSCRVVNEKDFSQHGDGGEIMMIMTLRLLLGHKTTNKKRQNIVY